MHTAFSYTQDDIVPTMEKFKGSPSGQLDITLGLCSQTPDLVKDRAFLLLA
jgi:hypothetical protein